MLSMIAYNARASRKFSWGVNGAAMSHDSSQSLAVVIAMSI